MNKLINWIEAHQLECYVKANYGVECPGCGFQTSFIFLLQGNIIESFHAYPGLIPLLFSMLLIILFKIFKKNWIEKVLIICMISTALIIIGNFLLKRFLY